MLLKPPPPKMEDNLLVEEKMVNKRNLRSCCGECCGDGEDNYNKMGGEKTNSGTENR